jgi:hypothetical protein
VADDRQSAETPAPADATKNGAGRQSGGDSGARRIAVPEQPTRAVPAPSTSQHERDLEAARTGTTAKPKRRIAHVYSKGKSAADAVRTRLAAAVWMAAVLAAVALSLGALLVALDANTENSLVAALLDLDRAIDGPFWKVFDFYEKTKSGARGAPDDVKNHLVNWGLAAAGYLLVGRLLERIIRPVTR